MIDMDKTKTSVLLIENNPDDTFFIQEMLSGADEEMTSFELTSFGRLSTGLDRLSEGGIDIILLDLSLPDSHGIDTFKSVYEVAAKIPIVVLSGLDDKKLAMKAVQIGAQDYLVKGRVDGNSLVRAIHYAIVRKQAEETLKEANEELRKLDQLKSDFISIVSHELRTPIAIMQEGISLCLDGVVGKITDEQGEVLTSTLDTVDRLARLVNDLLDISKIESGKFKLRRSSLDLNQIIKKEYENYEKLTKEKGIRLQMALPEGPLKLYADEDKVTQIFKNLLSNAIRFTEAGGEITIKAEEKDDAIVCGVCDTGTGISKEYIPKLFSKFEQFGKVDGHGYKGTGLGLAIVKGLVEEHEGSIWVESELGKGSEFWFTLKKVPYPKILIADDEEPVRVLFKRFLSSDNYQFVEVSDGGEAIQKALNDSVSLIILDMMLPDISGYEIIGRLKQDVRTHDIPILIVSGYSVDEARLDQEDNHVVIPYLNKPVEVDELRNKVRELLMN